MRYAGFILTNVCRLTVAITFILSGFVKAIDPLGTQYKIQDYLAAMPIHWSPPDWMTLTASIALSTTEFTLGMLTLFAIQRRIISKMIAVTMTFMTALTVWIFVADPIQDCGCFGDAITLTNGQSLAKNIVLTFCAVIMTIWPLKMPRLISKSNQWIVKNYTVIFIFAISTVSLYTLPPFDFRPYHEGADIKKGMEIPKGAEQPEFETTFILKKGNMTREFSLDNYPDSTWQFVDSRTIQTKEGYVAPIHDFSIVLNDTGEDITDSVLNYEGYTFLLISPHLAHADDSNFGTIDRIYEYSQDFDVPFYCLTASPESAIKRWQELTGAEYPFCTTDETTLKTIIRSNPGLVLMKNGKIVRKWSHNRLPNTEDMNGKLEDMEIGHAPDNSTTEKIVMILLWFVLPLTLLTLADRTWAWTKWMRKKKKE